MSVALGKGLNLCAPQVFACDVGMTRAPTSSGYHEG